MEKEHTHMCDYLEEDILKEFSRYDKNKRMDGELQAGVLAKKPDDACAEDAREQDCICDFCSGDPCMWLSELKIDIALNQMEHASTSTIKVNTVESPSKTCSSLSTEARVREELGNDFRNV